MTSIVTALAVIAAAWVVLNLAAVIVGTALALRSRRH